MADLYSTNRLLTIKRCELMKSTAIMNIHAREVRLLELEDESQRNKDDIVAQKKVIEEAEKNIAQQKQEMEKEKAEAAKATEPKQG